MKRFNAAVVLAAAVATDPAARAGELPPNSWSNCLLVEDLPGGGVLMYQSNIGPGWPSVPPMVTWSSSQPGMGGPLQVTLSFGTGPANPPNRARVSYILASPPQSDDYRVILESPGSAQRATLPLTGAGRVLSSTFNRPNPAEMADLAVARQLTATVYRGDTLLGRSTFDLLPERRETGLAVFARRSEAKDPSICRASSGPPLPVPPVMHRAPRGQ